MKYLAIGIGMQYNKSIGVWETFSVDCETNDLKEVYSVLLFKTKWPINSILIIENTETGPKIIDRRFY